MKNSKILAVIISLALLIPAVIPASALQFTQKPQFRAWDSVENGVILMEGFDGNGKAGSFSADGVSSEYNKPTIDDKTGFATPDTTYYDKDKLPYAFAFYGDNTYVDADSVITSGWYWNGSAAIGWTSDGSKDVGLRTKFSPLEPNKDVYIYYLYGSQNTEEGAVIGCAVEFWDADLNLLKTEKIEKTIKKGASYAGEDGSDRPNGTFTSPDKTAYVTFRLYYGKGVACSNIAFDTFMAKLADSSIAVNSTEANTGRCSAEKDADAAVAKAYFDAHPATTTEEPTTEEPVETGDGLVFVVIALVISASCAVVFSKKRAR